MGISDGGMMGISDGGMMGISDGGMMGISDVGCFQTPCPVPTWTMNSLSDSFESP